MHPAPWLRASDADREVIVARLSAAAVDGRLTLEEFSDRTERVYASRTWGELARLVGDLPTPSTTDAGATTGSGTRLPLLALVFGLLSIPAVSWMPVGWVLGVVAIVLGLLGLRTAAPGLFGGRGLAVAGLVCGSLGVVVQAAMIGLIAVV